MISPHVKLTCYLHMGKGYRSFSSMLNGAVRIESEMVWEFSDVYIINRTLHGYLEKRNFTSRVENYFTSELRSLVK